MSGPPCRIGHWRSRNIRDAKQAARVGKIVVGLVLSDRRQEEHGDGHRDGESDDQQYPHAKGL
jgi:hypothetical protein